MDAADGSGECAALHGASVDALSERLRLPTEVSPSEDVPPPPPPPPPPPHRGNTALSISLAPELFAPQAAMMAGAASPVVLYGAAPSSARKRRRARQLSVHWASDDALETVHTYEPPSPEPDDRFVSKRRRRSGSSNSGSSSSTGGHGDASADSAGGAASDAEGGEGGEASDECEARAASQAAANSGGGVLVGADAVAAHCHSQVQHLWRKRSRLPSPRSRLMQSSSSAQAFPSGRPPIAPGAPLPLMPPAATSSRARARAAAAAAAAAYVASCGGGGGGAMGAGAGGVAPSSAALPPQTTSPELRPSHAPIEDTIAPLDLAQLRGTTAATTAAATATASAAIGGGGGVLEAATAAAVGEAVSASGMSPSPSAAGRAGVSLLVATSGGRRRDISPIGGGRSSPSRPSPPTRGQIIAKMGASKLAGNEAADNGPPAGAGNGR